MKKVISFMISILMIFSVMALCPAFASAESSVTPLKKADSFLSKTETVFSDGGTVVNTYDSRGILVKRVYTYPDGRKITETTTNTYNANGDIKQSNYVYTTSEGALQTQVTDNTYDTNGNLTKSVYTDKYSHFNSYSYFEKTTANTYDSKGNIKKSICISNNTFGEVETTMEINSYDSKGNLTKKVYTYDNMDTATTTNTYDSNGNLEKSVYEYTTSAGATQTQVTTNSYDSNGNLTNSFTEYSDDSTHYDSDTRSKSIINTYDSNGNLTKSIYTFVYDYGDGDGDAIREKITTTNKYDAAGNLTKSTCETDRTDNLGRYVSTKTTTNTYNAAGNLSKNVIKFVDNEGDNYTKTTTNSYDDNGKLTKSNYVDTADEEKSTTTYTYKNKDDKISTYTSVLNGENKYTFTLCDVYAYTGSEIKPNVIIRVDGKELNRFEDYTLTYTDNIKIGSGKITVKFIDSRMKDVVLPFKITLKAPAELKATQTTSEITLNWKNVPNAAKYEVYMYNSAKKAYEKKTTVTANKATVKSLKAGTSYKFYVVAVDSTGKIKGMKSSVLTTSTKTTAPAELKASATTASITLTWKKVTGASKYEVYMYNASKKAYEKKTTVTANKATLKSLKAGTSYKFYVVAVDSTGKIKSAKSSVLTTGTKTVAPTATLKSTKSKTATVSWKKVAGASKYVVYKSTDNKNWAKATETTKLTCELTKLTAGKKIYVKVVAVNAYNQNSAGSKVVSVTVKK